MKKIKIVLASLGFTLFVAGSVAAAEACNAQDTKTNQVGTQSTEQQNMDDFFEKFAAELNSPNVVHLKKHNRLLLLKFSNVAVARVGAILLGILTALAAMGIIWGTLMHNAWIILSFGLWTAFFASLFCSGVSIYFKEQYIKNNPTPYLLFDSIGVKKNNSNDYSLKWKDVAKRYVSHNPDCFFIEFYCFLDKFGTELLRTSVQDNMCPVPLDQVKKIFDHCLSKYGSEDLETLEYEKN